MSQIQDELKGAIKEVFHNELKSSKEEQEKKNQEWQEAFSKKSESEKDEIVKRIEAIEKLPIQKMSVKVPGTDKTNVIHYGYKADKQLVDLFKGEHKEAVVNAKLFPIINDAEKKDHYAKHILMCTKAAMGDINAKMDYQNWRKEYVQKADMAEGAGATGGYLVPDEFGDEIVGLAYLNSVVLKKATVVPMKGDILKYPTRSGSFTVTEKLEAAALDRFDPTVGQVVLNSSKVGGYTRVSNELLEDNQYDLVSFLTQGYAEAIGQYLDNQTFRSASVGLLTNAGVSVDMSAGNTAFSNISTNNLLDMIDGLDQRAEAGAEWYWHKNIQTHLRKLKDTTGQYLLAPVGGIIPKELFEYAYNRVNEMPKNTDSAISTPFVIFGNLKYYLLGRRRQTTTLDIDPYGMFLEGQTRFKIEQRWAFGIGLANAFARLVTAAA